MVKKIRSVASLSWQPTRNVCRRRMRRSAIPPIRGVFGYWPGGKAREVFLADSWAGCCRFRRSQITAIPAREGLRGNRLGRRFAGTGVFGVLAASTLLPGGFPLLAALLDRSRASSSDKACRSRAGGASGNRQAAPRCCGRHSRQQGPGDRTLNRRRYAAVLDSWQHAARVRRGVLQKTEDWAAQRPRTSRAMLVHSLGTLGAERHCRGWFFR